MDIEDELDKFEFGDIITPIGKNSDKKYVFFTWVLKELYTKHMDEKSIHPIYIGYMICLDDRRGIQKQMIADKEGGVNFKKVDYTKEQK